MSEGEDILQKQLDEPMKWVGLYIATASAVCVLAMAADIFHGVRSKRFWFPCKYFSLNAAFLTLLAVAMKPAVDLSDQLYKNAELLTKTTSLIFMCMAIVKFTSSLGSMSDQSILTNTTALGILGLTVTGNMWIQAVQLSRYIVFHHELFKPTLFILGLLVTLVSSAIMVPNIKRSLESKYQEMHKLALREEHAVARSEKFTVSNQMEKMKKYWVMAETSSPEFVMARSVVSTTSSAACLLATFELGMPPIGYFIWLPIIGMASTFLRPESVYKWSAQCILAIQSIGIVVGLVTPTLRFFNNVIYKCSTMSCKGFRNEFTVESYWIQTLIDWRDGLSGLQIGTDNCRKYFHGAKWLIMNICIGIQILVVLFCKVVVFVSFLVMTPFVASFNHIRIFSLFVSVLLTTRVMRRSSQVISSNDHVRVELGDGIARNLSRYVLLLEGEPELPERMVKKICRRADKVIEIGKKQQPENLIGLLRKAGNFSGVKESDNIQVRSLHSQEPRSCWTLPLVTLTSIAIALPNVANHKAKQLLSSVSEGMSLAKLIDGASDTNGEIANPRKAADVAWASVSLYRKWQNLDLRKSSYCCKNFNEIIRELSEKAELIVRQFKRGIKDYYMENPLNWPVRVIAANSMYRICETILLSITGENEPTEDDLFEKLSVMIADIFAACLTNLPPVISSTCHQSRIEKREKSVREAFLLLGKTEGILELLQQREWPSPGPGYNVLSIDDWRAFCLYDDENPVSFSSVSSNETLTTQLSSVESLSMPVDF